VHENRVGRVDHDVFHGGVVEELFQEVVAEERLEERAAFRFGGEDGEAVAAQRIRQAIVA
jgi:hypothetical protein